ncbi:MAG: hypothetical protein JKY53_08420 [Flavobacteriales bacterium]|nr:hypothetical protein [Flavobacteriales bacterium]
MRLFVSIILITTIGFSSCKKAVKNYPEIVGDWRGETPACGLTITIPAEGKAHYYKLCDTIYVESYGIPYLKSKESILKIGKREFNISSLANDSITYAKNDTLRFILDGVIFSKID